VVLAARLRTPALTAGAGAAVAAALLLRDPHQHGSWGFCPFLALTGLPCPACGGLRAANDLLHGRVEAALSSNAYAVLTACVIALGWVFWAIARVRGTTPAWNRHTSRAGTLWFGGLLLFGALRMVPALSGLQP
jgi:Protein of unknown function (DUF2752)